MPPRFKLRTKIQKKLIKQKITTKKIHKTQKSIKNTHVQLFEHAQNVTCMRKREKREPEMNECRSRKYQNEGSKTQFEGSKTRLNKNEQRMIIPNEERKIFLKPE